MIEIDPKVHQELERVLPLPEPVADWDDILRRAGEPLRRRRRTMHRRLLVLAIVAVAVGVGAGAYAYVSSSSAPGLSAGVSALDRLPPVSSLPPNVAFFVGRSASAFGEDPIHAKRRVRLLRSGLGTMKSDLYAYRRDDGAVCFVVTENAGACARRLAEGWPGVEFVYGGGYPRWAHPRRYPNGVPRNVAGVVADSVASVTLVVGETKIFLPIVNNSIFGEYPTDANPGARVFLEVRYTDGKQRVLTLPNSAP